MASLYRQKKSPFWWIKFRDPSNPRYDSKGKIIPNRESTGLRIGHGPDTRKAEQLEAEYTLRERQINPNNKQGAWDGWVYAFLNLRYRKSPSTLERGLTCWRNLRYFLIEKAIPNPATFTREHCFDYIEWRNHPNKAKGKYKACYNTALLELKFMRVIMREAVKREYLKANPCTELGLKKDDPKLKPAIPPHITALIREKIQSEPEPIRTTLHLSFELAYYHGVRQSATWLNPMEDVWQDDEGWKIRFIQKGNRISVKFLHPELIPLFEKLRADKRTETYPKPPTRQWLGALWHKFLKRHKITTALPGITFHSTRVTVATTLAEKGVDQRLAMEYMDHASTTVHAIYLRLKARNSTKICHDAIK